MSFIPTTLGYYRRERKATDPLQLFLLMMKPERAVLNLTKLIRWAGLLAVCFCLLITAATAQPDNRRASKDAKAARRLGTEMLRDIRSILKKEYYDPNFRRVNLDESFKRAEQKLQALETYSQVFRAVAEVLIELNDSHTNFYPPKTKRIVDYGFSWQMIGNGCYVVAVKKGSDADVKGLRVGDIITAVGNYNPTRESLWLITYLWYRLDPQEGLMVLARGPDGSKRELLIEATRIEREEVIRRQRNEKPFRCDEVNPDLIACKLYTFSVEKSEIDNMMKQVRKHKKVILDLRSNGGGAVEIEMYLTGYFFERDVKIGDEKTRKKIETRTARTHKDKAFTGDLIVLIDSESSSAAEVFTRVIQIEKRGKVIGDVSGGRVMTSIFFPIYASELHTEFGLSVTIGDLVMSDGKSLEGVGVIPDEIIWPTGKALAEGLDPILAYAAGVLGAQLTPEQAGRFGFIKRADPREK